MSDSTRSVSSVSCSRRIWRSKIFASSSPGVALGAVAHELQAVARARERGVEALDLRLHLVVRDDALRDLGHLPAQEVHRADDDAGRRRRCRR